VQNKPWLIRKMEAQRCPNWGNLWL